MPKITKTFCERACAPENKHHVVYWDGGHERAVKGYGLRVTARGAKSFIVAGRVRGRQLQFTIGPFGQFTEAEARAKARSVLQGMREGIDPRDVRRADEAMAVTLDEVCEAYCSRPGKLKQKSAEEYRRIVRVSLARWRHRPVASITEEDVRRRYKELLQGGVSGDRPSPGSANAAMRCLRLLINFAGRQYRRADGAPLIERNPVDGLRDHWVKLGTKSHRYVPMQRVGAVWNALLDARLHPRNRDHHSSLDLTMFALLTGARREEMASLTWDRVKLDDDPAKCSWHIDERKRGEPLTLPLSTQATALLRQRPRRKLPDGTDSPYVFPSWGKSGRMQDPRVPMELVSKIAGEHLSIHDLRRTMTVVAMRECRIGKFEVDLLTGHKPNSQDVTARHYLDLEDLTWLQPEAERVGAWIEQQAATAAGENVVELRA